MKLKNAGDEADQRVGVKIVVASEWQTWAYRHLMSFVWNELSQGHASMTDLVGVLDLVRGEVGTRARMVLAESQESVVRPATPMDVMAVTRGNGGHENE